MPVSFPVGPSVNDEYTYNDRTWIWTGTAWAIKRATLNYLSVVEALGYSPVSDEYISDEEGNVVVYKPLEVKGTINTTTSVTINGVAVGVGSVMLAVEDQALTGGTIVTSKNLGTKSSGTLTLDMGARPLQNYNNGGAHILAPGSNTGSCLVAIINVSGAGAITTSGWTFVIGSAFTTTVGDDFVCHCSVSAAGSLLSVQAMQ